MVGFQNNIVILFNKLYQLYVRNICVYVFNSYFYWLNLEYNRIEDDILNLNCSSFEWLFDCLYFNNFNNFNNFITKNELNNLSLKLNSYRLVFINGFFIPYLSDNNFNYLSIKVKRYYSTFIFNKLFYTNFYTNFIECFTKQIFYINLLNDVNLVKPIYILHLNIDKKGFNNKKYIFHSYLNINIKSNSCCSIVEHFVSLSTTKCFSNFKTNINVGDFSVLNYIKLINENNFCYYIYNNDVYINFNSNYFGKLFFLGVNFIKYYINLNFLYKNSKVFLVSFILPFKYSVVEFNSFIYHKQGYCYSYQLHKVITIYCCKVLLSYLIKVKKFAVKSKSLIINNNLLLNNLSEISSKPKLEICSNNVKCNHAVTVGFISEDQIFFLRSRGINLYNSFLILIYAFFIEIFKNVNIKVVFSYLILHISCFLYGVKYFYELFNKKNTI